jgi:hypothetical protein
MTCTGVAAKRSFQSFTVNWAERTNDRAGAKPWLSGRHGHSRGWCAAPSGLRFDLMRPYGGDASCQCRRDDGAAQAGADHSKTPPDIWPIRPSISAVFPTRSEHSRRTLWSARARHRHEPTADRGGRCRHCSPGQVIRYRQTLILPISRLPNRHREPPLLISSPACTKQLMIFLGSTRSRA